MVSRAEIKGLMLFYISCSALVMLWYKKIASPLDNVGRTIFILSLGAGLLIAALICDGTIKIKVSRHVLITGSAVFACVFTPAALIGQAFLVPAGFFGGALFIMLQLDGLCKFPYEYRCLSFGIVFAASGMINTLTDLPELPVFYMPGPPQNIIIGVVSMASCALLYIIWGKKLVFPEVHGKAKGKYAKVALIAMAVSCVAYIVFGVKDNVAYPNALDAASSSGWIRLIEVPMFIGVGYLCDRLGRYVMLLFSLCLALLGTAGILFGDNTAIRVILEGCSFFSMIAFATSICVILADLSHYSKHPAIMVGMGFAPLIVSQLLSLPLAAIKGTDNNLLFIIAFIPCVALIPVVIRFIEAVRAVYSSENIKQYFSGNNLTSVQVSCGLSSRETQVFELIMEGKTVTEMSQILYLTESTVKQHITKILKKTGMPNRAQLIKAVSKQ